MRPSQYLLFVEVLFNFAQYWHQQVSGKVCRPGYILWLLKWNSVCLWITPGKTQTHQLLHGRSCTHFKNIQRMLDNNIKFSDTTFAWSCLSFSFFTVSILASSFFPLLCSQHWQNTRNWSYLPYRLNIHKMSSRSCFNRYNLHLI